MYDRLAARIDADQFWNSTFQGSWRNWIVRSTGPTFFSERKVPRVGALQGQRISDKPLLVRQETPCYVEHRVVNPHFLRLRMDRHCVGCRDFASSENRQFVQFALPGRYIDFGNSTFREASNPKVS